jgi:hypothetical protein
MTLSLPSRSAQAWIVPLASGIAAQAADATTATAATAIAATPIIPYLVLSFLATLSTSVVLGALRFVFASQGTLNAR